MKCLEKLQESYEKELGLAKKHKKRADELKQKIDEQKTFILQKKMQDLQLTMDEYERFLMFVSDRDSVISALPPEEMEEAIRRTAAQEEEEEMKAINEESKTL
jgi:hypothetical protein